MSLDIAIQHGRRSLHPNEPMPVRRRESNHSNSVDLPFNASLTLARSKCLHCCHKTLEATLASEELHSTQKQFYQALFKRGGDLLGGKNVFLLHLMEAGVSVHHDVACIMDRKTLSLIPCFPMLRQRRKSFQRILEQKS